MRITQENEVVVLTLSEQEDVFMARQGGLLDTVLNCEEGANRIRPLVSAAPPFYIIPRTLLPAFLRYPAINPQEMEFQRIISDFLGS